MNVAYRTHMPVMIHSRDACQDTIDILKSNHGQETGGIIHCYSYSREAARDFLNMGFSIGIGGVLTFKNARKLVEAAAYIPWIELFWRQTVHIWHLSLTEEKETTAAI